ISFCRSIEPSVGGINLEDISSPSCFEVLEILERELTVPVFHDDQDGTAIVTLAALINACRVTGRKIEDLKVVMNGAGAAGIAIARLLLRYGVKDIRVLDRTGLLSPEREGLNKFKREIALQTNKEKLKGRLEEALPGTDVLIGVSEGGIATKDMIRSMNPEPIVFAMANPTPEIWPKKAKEAGAVIVGTGRSDYSNQINNALVFPGIFRGLLDSRVRKVTPEMKIEAAWALAHVLDNPSKNRILPRVTDRSVVDAIASRIKRKNGKY
ncbi:MAG TPA: malic enzyme-like NAD(P)-binding protein, partial [Patescibacteria group bacterium]|nr:malic enzyme-like NAD(P)-binding protein [Patescibacteria group bacterium]